MTVKGPFQPKLLYDCMKHESYIKPSVNGAKSPPVAKDDKINSLPLEENTMFVFSSLFYSSSV